MPKHSIPCGIVDPERLIFHGGTAPGPDAKVKGIRYLAYDLDRRRMIHTGPDGPARAFILARSTGRVYWVAGAGEGPLLRFDPEKPGPAVSLGGRLGLRAATDETADGLVYAVSSGQGARDAQIWALDTKAETVSELTTAAVGSEAYVATLDVDPTGRYLYYIPGAHGGGPRDGSPIVQLDVRTRRKKVLAFLHPYYRDTHGLTLQGTYGAAVSPEGDVLHVTWNVSRGGRTWDVCALAVVRIPESERRS